MPRAFLLLLLPICTVSVHADGLWRDKITASDGTAGDSFGYSVSTSGDVCIVGTVADEDAGDVSGSAYIFRFQDQEWVQEQKLLAADATDGNGFGVSVSIDGDVCVVGAHGDDDEGDFSGSTYIFRFHEPNWLQEAKLTAFDGAEDDWFGWSVSISGNVCIVGAPRNDDNGTLSGSAYIFRFDESNWLQEAKLTAFDGAQDDWFGYSVSISGDVCIVGAEGADIGAEGDDKGCAYIFQFDDPNWIQKTKLKASDGELNDNLGSSVSISDGVCIVGAERDPWIGSAYIFRAGEPNWVQETKLMASDGEAWDGFGCSVSVDGNLCVVGARGDDYNGELSGAAYIFWFDGSTWIEKQKLLAFDGAQDDRFGDSVSIDNGNIVVGAPEFFTTPGPGMVYTFRPCPQADISGDCFVGLEDLFIFVRQWLTGANPL